ncbi:MAG: hypothetical protein L6Q71_02210, partial [Planctomycetes bacterium]|nr:hypothetical protein [Planctomycetota bacterium]
MIQAIAEAQASLSEEPTAGIEDVITRLAERGRNYHDEVVPVSDVRMDQHSGELLVGKSEHYPLRPHALG